MTNDAWGNQLKVNFASGILLFTTFVQNPSAEAMMKVSPARSERDTDFFLARLWLLGRKTFRCSSKNSRA